MKNKFLISGTLAFVCIFAINAYAVGQNSNTVTGNQVQQQTQTVNQGEDGQIQVQNSVQTQSGDGNGEQVQSQTANQGEDSQVQSQNSEDGKGMVEQVKIQAQQGQVSVEQHRSVVANFVQSLLQVADREQGIGQQVRIIAQQQNQSATTMVQAMEKVQIRSKVKTFFFGTDYKNLGTLRSETAQTENRLNQLNNLMENIQNEGDKTEIQSQIQVLKQEQVKIENFVKEQEGKFSLFGWLVKLFNK